MRRQQTCKKLALLNIMTNLKSQTNELTSLPSTLKNIAQFYPHQAKSDFSYIRIHKSGWVRRRTYPLPVTMSELDRFGNYLSATPAFLRNGTGVRGPKVMTWPIGWYSQPARPYKLCYLIGLTKQKHKYEYVSKGANMWAFIQQWRFTTDKTIYHLTYLLMCCADFFPAIDAKYNSRRRWLTYITLFTLRLCRIR